LTLKPINLYLEAWNEVLSPRGFVHVEPRNPPVLGHQRRIFMPPEILDIFSGETISAGFPDYRANVQATAFISGFTFTGSLIGDPMGKRPELERLDGLAEAWAMCFRSPAPGWRLFGRFVAKGVFVGLSLVDRKTLNGRATYTGFAQRMLDKWGMDHSAVDFVNGSAWSDYVDGRVFDVDQDRRF
jgi:hypothetical protein